MSLAYAGTFLALAGLGGVTAVAATSAAAQAAVSPAPAGAGAGPPLTASFGDLRAVAAPGRAAAAHPSTAHTSPAATASHTSTAHASARSWRQVRDALARQTTPQARPGTLPMADRLVAGAASGPQSALPITPSRMANATTIVRQALAKKMGVRAAVIAVATAMQESGLENLSYGDRDSLGLFQQRPSMGWGSASQLTTPSYAADAFLDALAAQQKADPRWAGQPLWETAQAVQKSGFPYAYAKWETQAAQLVSAIAMKLG